MKKIVLDEKEYEKLRSLLAQASFLLRAIKSFLDKLEKAQKDD